MERVGRPGGSLEGVGRKKNTRRHSIWNLSDRSHESACLSLSLGNYRESLPYPRP